MPENHTDSDSVRFALVCKELRTGAELELSAPVAPELVARKLATIIGCLGDLAPHQTRALLLQVARQAIGAIAELDRRSAAPGAVGAAAQ